MNCDFRAPHNAPLETLLRRGDIWRGHSQHFVDHRAQDTGYEALNAALLHRGWPLGTLVEVCQPSLCGHSEWQLLAPALRRGRNAYSVLLNPPALPFAQRLLQLGLDLERLLVVQARDRRDFLNSFVELARTEACDTLLAWQPPQAPSYTQLRKCLLAIGSGRKLTVLFRPARAAQQSSPASLRLASELQTRVLRVELLKQKGLLLKKPPAVTLPLPASWQPAALSPSHNQRPPGARIIPLRETP